MSEFKIILKTYIWLPKRKVKMFTFHSFSYPVIHEHNFGIHTALNVYMTSIEYIHAWRYGVVYSACMEQNFLWEGQS